MNEIEEAQFAVSRRRMEVADKARQGRPPRQHFTDDELEYWFRSCPDELVELEQQAAAVFAARAEKQHAKREWEVLDRMTKRVLAEREAAAKKAAYADAEKEARRRLSEATQ